MRTFKARLWIACTCALSLFLVGITSSYAQMISTPALISDIFTGWNADSIRVVTRTSIINPGNCATPDGYVLISVNNTTTTTTGANTATSTGNSASSSNGYQTHYQALLTAFSLDQPVRIVVSNTECVNGRPKIWGVYMSKP
jgi:hypothetical protein